MGETIAKCNISQAMGCVLSKARVSQETCDINPAIAFEMNSRTEMKDFKKKGNQHFLLFILFYLYSFGKNGIKDCILQKGLLLTEKFLMQKLTFI